MSDRSDRGGGRARSLLADVARACGGAVEDQEALLRVSLPEEGEGAELARRLGARELELVFAVEALAPGRELVTPGARVLRTVDAFLAERGRRSYLERVGHERLTLKALRASLRAARGLRFTLGAREDAPGYELYVVYRARYHARERVDRLLTIEVALRPDLAGGAGEPRLAALSLEAEELEARLAAFAPAALAEPAGAEAEGARGFVERPRKQLPAGLLARALDAADACAAERARVEGARLGEEARRSFGKDLTRLEAYYSGQIADYARQRRSELARLRVEELEEERALRIQELVRACEVSVELEPLQLLVVERPLQAVRAALAGAADAPAAELPLLFDRFSGALELPPCRSCGAQLGGTPLAPCAPAPQPGASAPAPGGAVGGHVAHAACLAPCGRCAARVCGACARPCASCGRAACGACALDCPSCGEVTCRDHLGACVTCGEPGCARCLRPCAHCERPTCPRDALATAGARAVLCPACAQACPGCGVPTSRKELVRCATCGRRLCAGCHPPEASACALCLGA